MDVSKRDLSARAFTKHGNDAALYNGVHDLETAYMQLTADLAAARQENDELAGRSRRWAQLAGENEGRVRDIAALVGLPETATGEQVAEKVRECAKDRERLDRLNGLRREEHSWRPLVYGPTMTVAIETTGSRPGHRDIRGAIDEILNALDAIPAPGGEPL